MYLLLLKALNDVVAKGLAFFQLPLEQNLIDVHISVLLDLIDELLKFAWATHKVLQLPSLTLVDVNVGKPFDSERLAHALVGSKLNLGEPNSSRSEHSAVGIHLISLLESQLAILCAKLGTAFAPRCVKFNDRQLIVFLGVVPTKKVKVVIEAINGGDLRDTVASDVMMFLVVVVMTKEIEARQFERHGWTYSVSLERIIGK